MLIHRLRTMCGVMSWEYTGQWLYKMRIENKKILIVHWQMTMKKRQFMCLNWNYFTRTILKCSNPDYQDPWTRGGDSEHLSQVLHVENILGKKQLKQWHKLSVLLESKSVMVFLLMLMLMMGQLVEGKPHRLTYR